MAVRASDPERPGVADRSADFVADRPVRAGDGVELPAAGDAELAVFELFVRHLPLRRRWLLAAGLGPALALVRAMEFGEEELAYVRSLDPSGPQGAEASGDRSADQLQQIGARTMRSPMGELARGDRPRA